MSNSTLDQEFSEWMKDRLPSDTMHVRSESKDGKMVFVAWLNGRPVGQAQVSVMPLVHDMEIEESTVQRKVADALFQYMSGYVRASGFSESIVLVSDTNLRMQRYVEARSVPEEPSKVYLLEVK